MNLLEELLQVNWQNSYVKNGHKNFLFKNLNKKIKINFKKLEQILIILMMDM